jgi:hypothetical protein
MSQRWAAPVRVLQLSRAAIDGGFDYHREISLAFAEPTFDVTTVFIRGQLPPAEAARYHGRVICLEVERRKHYKLPWVVALKLYLLNAHRPFDLVICHHYLAARALTALMKCVAIPKLYWVVHDYDYFAPRDPYGRRRHRLFQHALAQRCRLIAVSQALRANLLQTLPDLDPERCLVIHNAIDTPALLAQRLERQQARAALGLAPADFVFGTVGRLVPYKAQRELIEAFASVQAQMPTGRLAIIGRGPLHDELAGRIAQLGLENKIKLIGFLPQAARYMAAFDVFVLPSHNEPFGLVLLEAMAQRLAIIARANGAAPEILPDAEGLFAATDEVSAALAAKLLSFYRLPDAQRERLGESNYQRLRQHFSLANYRERYRQLWDGNKTQPSCYQPETK